MPELDASVVFEEDEILAAHLLNKNPAPQHVPTLNEVVRLVAMAGGFLGRKCDGELGAKTIWRGMERIQSQDSTSKGQIVSSDRYNVRRYMRIEDGEYD